MKHCGRKGRRRGHRLGLTVVEAMMALAVLSVAVLAVSHAVVAGQTHARGGDDAMRAVDLAQDLMEEILALSYRDPDGTSTLGPETGETGRSSFDNVDDFHGYTETVGTITDFAGNPYDAQVQAFARAVNITTTNESISELATSISGLTVTVTVTDPTGHAWTVIRFVPEFAP